MERLTKRYEDGMAYVPLNKVSSLNNECVGLPITKLAHYEDLEEKIKISVGRVVYKIFMSCPKKDFKLEYCADHEGACPECLHRDPIICEVKFSSQHILDLGKTVFFTLDEAMKKQAELLKERNEK